MSTASGSTLATLTRGALLFLAVVAASATLVVGRYLFALFNNPAEATDAFALVRAANALLLAAVAAAWVPLARWIATSSSAARQWRRTLFPGPFAGEPARLLARELGAHRSRSLQVLSLVAAYGWPLGLLASHLVHWLALIVGGAWAALGIVALLLRSALHASARTQRARGRTTRR